MDLLLTDYFIKNKIIQNNSQDQKSDDILANFKRTFIRIKILIIYLKSLILAPLNY